MIPAYSIKLMQEATDQTLGIKVRTVRKRVLSPNLALMFAGRPPPPPRYETKLVEEKTEQWSKLVGVLFCSPTSKLGKDEILPHMEYFHHRSALFVDFFCVGYGAHWPQGAAGGGPLPVARVADKKWHYSTREFNNCRHDLEAVTQWQYSGETDLLLAVARKRDVQGANIDFSAAISCNLEEMLKDGAITSVRSFFEKVFQFGEQFKGTDPVCGLSDKMGIVVGGGLIFEAILSLVPEPIRNVYKSTKHFAIRDISR